jgi:AAA domain
MTAPNGSTYHAYDLPPEEAAPPSPGPAASAVPPPSTGPRVVGWKEYLELELPPITWAIKFGEHGFLRTSGDVAVAGTPGSFKTTSMISACADLADQAGLRVGLVELEGDENDLRAEIARAVGERNIPNERILTARYDGFFSLMSEVYRADLRHNFTGRIDVLVLDSLPKMTAGVDENSPDFAAAVALAQELKRELGARLLIMICHTVKSEWRAGEEPCLADIRGHGSLAGVLDAAFILRPAKDARERVQEGTAHVELWPVKQRGAALGPPLDLAYTRVGNGLRRSFSVIDREARGKGGRPPDQSEPELDAAVLSFVRGNGPSSKRQVRGAVGGNDGRKDAALVRLVKAGQLEVNTTGRYFAPGFPFRKSA